jgi:hemerythrin-like domain-containing protein
MKTQRRQFLVTATTLGVSAWAGAAATGAETKKAEAENKEEDVSPGEDLMREHGILKRILLIYGDSLRKLRSNQDLPPEVLAHSAKIIRSFIEDYHEKLEEDFLFPRFRKAGKLVDLVRVLQEQHQAGRRLTDTTLRLATAAALKNVDDRKALAESLRLFIRMYSPHEAREDTVLFPAFHEIVTGHEYDALGDDFEKREHELFGKDGFEGMVDRVAEIEKLAGLYDLSQFTPKF